MGYQNNLEFKKIQPTTLCSHENRMLLDRKYEIFQKFNSIGCRRGSRDYYLSAADSIFDNIICKAIKSREKKKK